jgi:D-alanyl-D-alanine carboxypeptidase (penicillin-binding protein 5/6)
VGEQLPVRDLLYGLLLPSGNDASVALAEHFGSRLPGAGEATEPAAPHDRFVACMNAAAAELGMTATRYENPHGLTAKGHRSSARDLVRLARAALALPSFEQIVGVHRYECMLTGPGGYQRKVVWKNTNRLLEIEGYDGVKTGTTTAAGACLVSRGRHGSQALLVAVLGSASSEARYADTRNLFRWGWSRTGNEPRAAGNE